MLTYNTKQTINYLYTNEQWERYGDNEQGTFVAKAYSSLEGCYYNNTPINACYCIAIAFKHSPTVRQNFWIRKLPLSSGFKFWYPRQICTGNLGYKFHCKAVLVFSW